MSKCWDQRAEAADPAPAKPCAREALAGPWGLCEQHEEDHRRMSESAWERYLAHTPPGIAAQRAAEMVAATAAWDVDMLVDTHRGEKFWLGPCLNEKGERIGITECCFEDDPCARHREGKKL